MLEINKIYNGDSLELLKELDDESIDLVVTDPPYKTTSRGRGNKGTTTSGGMLEKKIVTSGKMFNHNDIKLQDFIPDIYRVLKEGTHFYIMTNNVNLQETLNVCIENGFHFIRSLIWNKGNKVMSQAYMNQFEYILFFRKGKFKKINNCGTADILDVPNKKTKGADGKNLHDTEKPVELMKILIENSSQEDEIVLDPFIGVGSTCLASKELNRQYIGFELDENYFNIAEKRIHNEV
jgi:site-specific DNA-methyltransferase (adenine-specific)